MLLFLKRINQRYGSHKNGKARLYLIMKSWLKENGFGLKMVVTLLISGISGYS